MRAILLCCTVTGKDKRQIFRSEFIDDKYVMRAYCGYGSGWAGQAIQIGLGHMVFAYEEYCM